MQRFALRCRAARSKRHTGAAAVVNDAHLTDSLWITCPCALTFSQLLFCCCFINAGTRSTPTKVNKQTHLNMYGSQSRRRHRHRAHEMEIFQYAGLGVCPITSERPRRWNAASQAPPTNRALHMQAQSYAADVFNTPVKKTSHLKHRILHRSRLVNPRAAWL